MLKELMTEYSQDEEAESLCRWAAARAGVIVIAPLVGTVALTANEVYLVLRLAGVYGVRISESAAVSFLGAVGGAIAGNMLASLIPVAALQVPIGVVVTYAVGKVAQAWIKDGMPEEMEPYVALLGEWKDKAKGEIDSFMNHPFRDKPLGDESKKFF